MTAERWIRRMPGSADTDYQLVCLPHAGGAASAFRPWRAYLPASVELVAVQYPGREDRMDEAPLTDLEELAAAVGAALLPSLSRPFVIFGHSMGALVGYELVRQLTAATGPLPELLVVSSQFSPGELPDHGIRFRDDEGVLDEVERLSGEIEELRRSPELTAFVAGLVRADFAAIETYRSPRVALPVPLAAFGGDDDPALAPDHLQAWKDVAGAGFSHHSFPGGHFYLRDHQRTVSAIVRLVAEMQGV
ncbi:pyochelin biosynthetic protein PchC [Amycolatopsis bartoniae]|uniref:Thioesterase n=1 Tax=Amycolatopsis bartoniae TaxID=941986 RepID=A0A8H9IXQ4_9PSEU|nr:alpha/beta fold hydrolase [Amycolatopsis bartoniae]MBB2940198.1 pyochelin biosynthetic protein PchC [Amycolatopsis bartoniae]TVT11290.1 thioesterase [Amycolatopsis bartoniae]GHF66348.1 thioesterase [Amycolatopsis bartoniae]